MLPLIVILDFDGTITQKDIGDEVCEKFATASWQHIDAAWVKNEITLPEAQRQIWALTKMERAEAVAYALEIGKRRSGLHALLDAVKAAGGEVWLASGGFDFYVEALLAEESPRFSRRYYNTARFEDGIVDIQFPHVHLACERCAVCKGKVCDEAKQLAERVIFVGDGSSDRCAVGRCDALFAVEGGILDRHCTEQSAAAMRFTSFDEVTRSLHSGA